MSHEPRLTRELRLLLTEQRTAALGTLTERGDPLVSMVPFAIEPTQACLVLHVSGLAAHTRQMQRHARVSLLVMQAEQAGEPVHALPRVSLEGVASSPEVGSAGWQHCRDAYLARFPEAKPMTELPDFRFVVIEPTSARHVAGFGAARTVDPEELRDVLTAP